jgi:hypothetical protein
MSLTVGECGDVSRIHGRSTWDTSLSKIETRENCTRRTRLDRNMHDAIEVQVQRTSIAREDGNGRLLV